jgi:hypothetical protein
MSNEQGLTLLVQGTAKGAPPLTSPLRTNFIIHTNIGFGLSGWFILFHRFIFLYL